MVRKNFILVKAIGTVTSTRTRIVNTDWIKSIYHSDEDDYVRIDIEDKTRTYTLKVNHSMKEMWNKVRGISV